MKAEIRIVALGAAWILGLGANLALVVLLSRFGKILLL